MTEIPTQAQRDAAMAIDLIGVSLRIYQTRDIRAGERSGLMDAAHICDAIGESIAADMPRKMPPPMRAAATAAVKRCAEAIMAARAAVDVPK